MIILNRSLVAVGLSVVLVISVVVYEDASYYGSPFSSSWHQNFGHVVNPSMVDAIIENGDIFILSVNSYNLSIDGLYGGADTIVLKAANATDGSGLWADSFVVGYYGVPQMYWHNGNLLIVSYAHGFGYNSNNYRQFNNYNILMMKFNPGTGSISNISRYNNSLVLAPNQLAIHDNELFGYSFQEDGGEYYSNGIPTTTFKVSLFGINLSSMNSWNQTFYVQGNPNYSSASLVVSNSTVAIVSNNIYTEAPGISKVSFFGFDSHSGNLSWSFSANGSFDHLWSAANHFYFVRENDTQYSLVTLNSTNGHEFVPLTIPSSNMVFVQGKFLYRNNGHYSSISLTGGRLWETKELFPSPVNSYYEVSGLSPGYALISSIGQQSVYHVINLSTGKIIWSSDNSLISSIEGGNGVQDVPVAYGNGYIVFVAISQNPTLNVMAVNINTFGINSQTPLQRNNSSSLYSTG